MRGSPVALNELSLSGSGAADGIVVSTDAEPRNLTYVDSKWGYVKNTVVDIAGRKFVKPVRVTDDSVIPAGVGFWYIRSEDAAGTATIDWVK